MGQRLTVNLMYEGDCVAGMYQHWSAYTHCSYEVVEEVLSGFEKVPESYDEAVLIGLKMFRCCPGASINHQEYNKFMLNKEFRGRTDLHKQIRALGKEFPMKADRNDGFIVVGHEAESVSGWGEYSVFIHLDTQIVEFLVWSEFESYEDFVDSCCYGASTVIRPRKVVLPEKIDPTRFKFDQIEDVCYLVNQMCNGFSYEFIMPDGRVLSAIA